MRILQFMTASDGKMTSYVTELGVDETRDPLQVCAGRIQAYKDLRGAEFMREPRWLQSLVRAAVLDVSDGQATPVIALEYNHTRGTAQVDASVFQNALPTAAPRL